MVKINFPLETEDGQAVTIQNNRARSIEFHPPQKETGVEAEEHKPGHFAGNKPLGFKMIYPGDEKLKS